MSFTSKHTLMMSVENDQCCVERECENATNTAMTTVGAYIYSGTFDKGPSEIGTASLHGDTASTPC